MNRKDFLKNTGLSLAALGLGTSRLAAQTREATNPYAFINMMQSPLKYSLTGLEPYISGQIMDIHYHKHAAGYLRKLSGYLIDHQIPSDDLYALIRGPIAEDFLVNNLGGHFNHEIFWRSLSPDKSLAVSAAFSDQIKSDFGGVSELANVFGDAAAKVFGSGWAWLCLEPESRKLIVTTTPNQVNPLMQIAETSAYPLVGIDVWEHAYYLQYQNRRADYIQAYGELLDWGFADTMYHKVVQWIG